MFSTIKSAEEEQPNRSLSYLFGHFLLEESEANRINQQIAEKGPAKTLILEYATRTNLYKQDFLKKVRIDGFRPARKNPVTMQQSLLALLEILRKPKLPAYVIGWSIYRQSLDLFVAEKLANLHALLGECSFDGDKPTANDLLRAVCISASEFGVSKADIALFYDVSWISRIENFENVLLLCEQRDEVKIQAKQLRQLTIDADSLRSDFKIVTDQEKKFEHTLAQLASELKAVTVKLIALQISQESLNLAVADSLPQAIMRLKDDWKIQESKLIGVESSSKNMEANFKKIETMELQLKQIVAAIEKSNTASNYAELSERLKIVLSKMDGQDGYVLELAQKVDSIRLEIAKLVDVRVSTMVSEICTELIGTAMSPIAAKMIALEESVQRLGRSSNTALAAMPTDKYRSPLSLSQPALKISFNVVKEQDFLRFWAQHLLQKNRVFSVEQLVAYHCVFLSSDVVIADFDLVSSWSHCLGWDRFTMDLVSSPAWSSELDWQEGTRHLFSGSKSNEARVLNLHNYDAGLVDCYLSPTVHLWALKQKQQSSLCKLFLVPCDTENVQSTDILNHAAVIVTESIHEWSQLQLVKDFGRDFPKTQLASCAVDPSSVVRWLTTSNSYEQEFGNLEAAIRDKLQIKLNSWTRDMCARTIAQCGRFFDEGSSINIGVATHILPWVRRKFGQDDHDMLNKYVHDFLGLKL